MERGNSSSTTNNSTTNNSTTSNNVVVNSPDTATTSGPSIVFGFIIIGLGTYYIRTRKAL